MCSSISYLFRISGKLIFPFYVHCTAKTCKQMSPILLICFDSLSLHSSEFPNSLSVPGSSPAPLHALCHVTPVQSFRCHSNCNKLQQWRTWMKLHLHTTVPTSWFSQPRELKQLHTAHVLSNLPSPGHPPESQPASKAGRSKSWEVRNLRGSVLPEPHKTCSLFACRRTANCYFSDFSPTH